MKFKYSHTEQDKIKMLINENGNYVQVGKVVNSIKIRTFNLVVSLIFSNKKDLAFDTLARCLLSDRYDTETSFDPMGKWYPEKDHIKKILETIESSMGVILFSSREHKEWFKMSTQHFGITVYNQDVIELTGYLEKEMYTQATGFVMALFNIDFHRATFYVNMFQLKLGLNTM